MERVVGDGILETVMMDQWTGRIALDIQSQRQHGEGMDGFSGMTLEMDKLDLDV